MRYFFMVGLVFLLVGCNGDNTKTDEGQVESLNMPERTVKLDSPGAVFKLFAELHYTRKEWAEGNRLVPRVYMSGIPERWRHTSQELTVPQKKELFFRLLGPLVLRSNELIAQDRARLVALKGGFDSLNSTDQKWFLGLAMQYKVVKADVTTLTDADLAKLTKRVDIIPVSLALAQGAEESGWGTSRFALLGNSLFGQWDFSGKGIKPKEQRKELGNYGLARFDTPQDSVIAYMRNLNTHSAYQGLRDYRAELRRKSKDVTGYELAKKLNKYSERGEKYVEGLHSIMRVNNLAPTDHAHFSNKEIIYLVPKS